MPRTYVDNAYNRRAGRVGLPHGSAVIPSSSSGNSYRGGSGSSSGTYVDNDYNRRAGRVGLPLGSAVISNSSGSGWNSPSAGSHSSNSSGNTYVDNAYNRRVGRVGLPHGSAVIPSSSSGNSYRGGSGWSSPSAGSYSSNSSGKTYVNNAYNRTVGRVGLPHSSAVISKSGSYVSNSSSAAEYGSSFPVPTYVNDDLNRKLGQVDLLRRSEVIPSIHPINGRSASMIPIHQNYSPEVNEVFVDDAVNCVRKPRGSMVLRSNSSVTCFPDVDALDFEKYFGFNPNVQRTRTSNGSASLHRDIFKNLLESPQRDDLDEKYTNVPKEQLSAAVESVVKQLTRVMEVKKWEDESKDENPRNGKSLIREFTGNKVKYTDIEIRSSLGKGAFGEVFAAKYRGSLIAVKKLGVQRVSKKRLQNFSDEIQILCSLEHPNIVKFIGACVVTPNLCICMEYMKHSLHDALHVLEKEFTEKQKLRIISNMSSGLEYLHSSKVAHCDVKSQNVLLDYATDSMDGSLTAKLTDFGLSMMKNNSDSVSTMSANGGFRGTYRYSAPEVLRGEMMSFAAWTSADVYSLSLVIYEVLCQEEPFDGLSVIQLTKQVGSQGKVPTLDEGFNVSEEVNELLSRCWSRNVDDRPTAKRMKTFFNKERELFEDL